jgi:hypothetical protein
LARVEESDAIRWLTAEAEKRQVRFDPDAARELADALGAALTRPDSTLDGSCEEVTSALHSRGEDDVTLVLARLLP